MSTKATKPAVVKLSEVNKIIENGKCYVLKCGCVEQWTDVQFCTGLGIICPVCGKFAWTSNRNNFANKSLHPTLTIVLRT